MEVVVGGDVRQVFRRYGFVDGDVYVTFRGFDACEDADEVFIGGFGVVAVSGAA